MKPSEAQASAQAAVAAKPKRHYRAWIFHGYLLTATIGFAVLFVLASTTDYFPIDLVITRGIQTIQAPGFFGLMWAVTEIGYSPQVYAVVGVIVLILIY